MQLPYIRLFRTRGKFYIYDVNKAKILTINKEIYDLLQKLNEGETVEHPWITKVQQMGYLSSNRVKKIVNPSNIVLEDYLNNKVTKITLQLTQYCNFRCEYCVYSDSSYNRHHSNKEMDFETAKKGIDFLIGHSKDSSSVNIGFYGGEPLLKYELIKECIEYAEKVSEGKNITFSITTNGSLINAEIIEYFSKHNVSLSISVDGPEHIQNKNRKFAFNNCGTFDKVMQNLKLIKEEYPEYADQVTISTVVDPNTDFKCTNNFFTTDEILKNSNIMPSFIDDAYLKNKVKQDENFSAAWEYEKFKLFLSMCRKINKEHTSKLLKNEKVNIDMFIIKMRKHVAGLLCDTGHHGGPCIPGQIRLFIDTRGMFYPCEKVLEGCNAVLIGDLDNGFDFEKVKTLLNIGVLTEKECINCFAFRECTICAGRIIDTDTKELSRKMKLINCSKVRANTEGRFKDISTLLEFGYDPDLIDNDSTLIKGGTSIE